MEDEKRANKRTGIGGAVALIAIGVILLMLKNGLISRELLAQWWPLALIAIGLWLLVTRLLRRGDGD